MYGEGNVFVDGEPVCDDGWDDNDGKVVCRQLGFSGFIHATKNSKFGFVDQNYAMNDVDCTG